MDKVKREMSKRCDVGGIHCDCCNPYRGKKKARLIRFARRKLKEEIRKLGAKIR